MIASRTCKPRSSKPTAFDTRPRLLETIGDTLDLYVNVNTAANPGGEMRGHLGS
ncbi:MAG: CHRD domain-containing protein [Casimicrobiaceae bacterium]